MARASRVFIRLLSTLPRIHGRTYPFLGFNWWFTEAGQPVVDNVYYPSPAADIPLIKDTQNLYVPDSFAPNKLQIRHEALQPGDIILSANGMPLSPWIKDWDNLCRNVRGILKYSLPGELLVKLLLAGRNIRQEAEGLYRGGPVELLIEREKVKKKITLYPIHLPAEYGIMVVSGKAGSDYNAFAAPGRIMITQKMVGLCRTDQELAIVLGHELAHQAHGHRARRAGQWAMGGMIGDLLSSFLTLSLPFNSVAPFPDVEKDLKRVTKDAVISVYSRDDEREADAYGLWYAFQAGYDIDQGVYIWERLSATVDRSIFDQTHYTDSHPPALERLARLKKIAHYFQAGRAAEVFLQTADLGRIPVEAPK
jgi:Zn-dependent protease with chaperone function